MGRLAVWGGSIVAAAVGGCMFDFDAPFAESGGGGARPSTGALASSGGTGGAASATTSAATGATTSASVSTGGGGDGGAGGASAEGGGGAEPEVVLVTVPCGEQPCTFDPRDGGGCCWDQRNVHAPPRGECFDAAPPPDRCLTEAEIGEREALIQCDDASDCPEGWVCCGAFASQGGINAYARVECAETCQGSDLVFCDPDDPDACPPGDTCQASSVLPDGYHVCR